MRLDFKFQNDDWKKSSIFATRKRHKELHINKLSSIYGAFTFVCIFVLFYLLLFNLRKYRHSVLYEEVVYANTISYFIILTIILLGIIFSFYAGNKYLKKMHDPEGPMVGDHTVEIIDDSIIQSTGKLSLRIALSSIREMVIKNDYLHIFYDLTGFITIPLNAFESRRQLDEFVERIHSASGATVTKA